MRGVREVWCVGRRVLRKACASVNSCCRMEEAVAVPLKFFIRTRIVASMSSEDILIGSEVFTLTSCCLDRS